MSTISVTPTGSLEYTVSGSDIKVSGTAGVSSSGFSDSIKVINSLVSPDSNWLTVGENTEGFDSKSSTMSLQIKNVNGVYSAQATGSFNGSTFSTPITITSTSQGDENKFEEGGA